VKTNTEIADKVSFDKIRYAQCWEDADILLEGLDIQAGDVCLGIGSAGENCFSMLTKNPAKVIAVDMNPAQLACIKLRIAGYQILEHHEFLQLIGSRPCSDRLSLYQKCRPLLELNIQQFWDEQQCEIEQGIGAAGKFERYFELFRTWIIPLIHSKKRVKQLLSGNNTQQCQEFYDNKWNNLRWRWLFKLFFSRFMMGRLGRDPEFFNYVQGSVADKILQRTRHALRELKPQENPYLHWILTGTHSEALPHALREENFELIKNNIHRLECRLGTVESVLESEGENSIDRFNLSDIFEYMSEQVSHEVLAKIIHSGRSKGRLMYWNMLAPRSCPKTWSDKVIALDELGQQLLLDDKAFFYSAVIVEELL